LPAEPFELPADCLDEEPDEGFLPEELPLLADVPEPFAPPAGLPEAGLPEAELLLDCEPPFDDALLFGRVPPDELPPLAPPEEEGFFFDELPETSPKTFVSLPTEEPPLLFLLSPI